MKTILFIILFITVSLSTAVHAGTWGAFSWGSGTWSSNNLPNLTLYQPSGWSDKIVVSKTSGSTTDSATFTTSDIIYIDWAVMNIGNSDITSRFYTKLYVDGVEKYSWYSESLAVQYFASNKDYNLGTLSAGTHEIKIVTDATNTILESNENDNEYKKYITVTATAVNGACGSSNGTTVATIPATNFCTTGTATAVTGTGPWSWSCAGSNGGTTATCNASIQTYSIAATSGANGTVVCTTPANNGAASTCTVTPASGYQLATFTDNSIDKKASVTGNNYSITNVTTNHSIVATFTLIQSTVVDGACGTSNIGTFSAAPTTNLCTTGTASTIIGSGTWYWACTGTNGGTTAICTAFSATASPTGTLTKTKVFLGAGNDNYTVSDSGTTLYGNTGIDTVTIAPGVTDVTLDQNIERINFSGASSSYAFKQTGNLINVYDSTGITLIVRAPVQGDSDGTQLSFSNGTASAKLTGGVMKLGGATISSGTANIITPTLSLAL